MDYLLVAAGDFSWFSPSSWWAIAQVVIGLGFVIFVHELGHFLAAKSCGVKCEKFYVGFDAFDIKIGDRVIIPRALVKWQWGETEYGVGIVPLGGYVKMLGQDDNPGNASREIERSMVKDESADSEKELAESAALQMIDRSKMDPRSFLAKSVIQRMWIISAGVIFNLAFAVIFAAIAFRSGVDFTPPVIGNVVAGGPAWQAKMAGSELHQIGDKTVGGYFTYINMAQEIAINGDDSPLQFTFQRPHESQPTSIKLRPVKGIIRGLDFALIGVSDSLVPKLHKEPLVEGHAASKAKPPLGADDEIIQVDQTQIESAYDLLAYFAQNRDREIEFVLKRTDKKAAAGKGSEPPSQIIKTMIPPNPVHELGLVMKWKPVVATQINSPAAIAGFKKGDLIISIDDEDRGDLLTLEERMTKIARDNPRTVNFKVLRAGELIVIPVTPRLPQVVTSIQENHPIGIESLGLAVRLSRTVERIIPGSPAADSDIKPGDRIKSVEFFLSDEQKKLFATIGEKPKLEMVQPEFEFGWSEMWDAVQILPIGSKFKIEVERLDIANRQVHHPVPLTIERGPTSDYQGIAALFSDAHPRTTTTAEMTSVQSEQFFLHTRGIRLTKLQRTYQSETVGDALSLGVNQTIFETKRVGKFLSKLVTGKISANNLGGPGTIAMVATSEASQGTSRLLLFLTLLSANLAIVNFLPIPVLDGGHMLFLMYEGIFRRPVSERAQVILTYAGLMFILGLMAFVILLDIGRISSVM